MNKLDIAYMQIPNRCGLKGIHYKWCGSEEKCSHFLVLFFTFVCPALVY